MHNFRFDNENDYLVELETILMYANGGPEFIEEYEELMDEFMEFYEVSGSGE